MRDLSDRQIEIDLLGKQGMTVDEISTKLGITSRRVIRQLNEIGRKESCDVGKRQRLAGSTPSARELQVLRSFAIGLTYTETAIALDIADGTVKFHAMNLFARLRARSAAHAVAIAFRRGLIV